jgi:hypothetical protein
MLLYLRCSDKLYSINRCLRVLTAGSACMLKTQVSASAKDMCAVTYKRSTILHVGPCFHSILHLHSAHTLLRCCYYYCSAIILLTAITAFSITLCTYTSQSHSTMRYQTAAAAVVLLHFVASQSCALCTPTLCCYCCTGASCRTPDHTGTYSLL